MIKKEKGKDCCDLGTYECTVPMPIKGKVQEVDYCISHIVAALNAANIVTIASCCGHCKIPASIMIEGGLELKIVDMTIREPISIQEDA